MPLPAASGTQASSPGSPAAQIESPAVSTSPRLAQLSEDYWETMMRLSPLSATFVKHPRYHDRLDDNSAWGRAQEFQELEGLAERLKTVDRSELGAADRLTWDVMNHELSEGIEGHRHKLWQWRVDHMDGPQSGIASVIELAQPMESSADAEALLRRMKALPAYFATHASNLREGLGLGRVAARVPVEKTIRQLEELLKAPSSETPYAAAGRKLPKELQERLLPEIVSAVESHVYPGYREYLRFLKEECLPKARTGNIGLAGIPDGLEAYRYLIRVHTTLDKSPEELHALGLEEVISLRSEISAIARRKGHEASLGAFFDKIRRDPDNFFKTREEVLKTAEALVARAKEKLPAYFKTLPKTGLVVKPVEEYKEQNEGFAMYYPPPDDLSRPGIYYINTYKPETRARFSMASTAAHEAAPGHHLQLALSIEKRDLPAFRRHNTSTAFVEGWALYAERLAEEMGLYEDDFSRLGMLSDQMLRAMRLVVDTGLHAKAWTRDRAIAFMKENSPMSEEEISTEVDRYTVWPGQALAYKVGQREIMALRRESQAELGAAFDLRAFHDSVLKNGALPLPVLRSVVLKTGASREP